MLLTRVISSLIGGPLLLFIVYRGGWFLVAVTVLLALLALRELFAMSEGLGLRNWKISGFAAGLVLVIGAYLEQGRFLPIIFVLWLLFCLTLFVINFPKERVEDLAFNFLALNYVVLLFAHLVLLRNLSQGVYLTFLTLGLTWATDTGAYFAGRALGKHKLAPKVSPNKTVEGAIGGIALAVLTAVVIGRLLPNQSLTQSSLILIACAVGVSAQLGDLVESAIKRFCGVKDSGKLIPGHGGVLDRFDSILFTIPTVYYLFLGLIIS